MHKQWKLTGSTSSYLIVRSTDTAARDNNRQVSATVVRGLLSGWIQSRQRLVREIYEALDGSPSLNVSLKKKDPHGALLKKRLEEAFASGLLVVLTEEKTQSPLFQDTTTKNQDKFKVQPKDPKPVYGPFRIDLTKYKNKPVTAEKLAEIACKQVFGLKSEAEAKALHVHMEGCEGRPAKEEIAQGYIDVVFAASLYEKHVFGKGAKKTKEEREKLREQLRAKSEKEQTAIRAKANQEFKKRTGRAFSPSSKDQDQQLWELLQDVILLEEGSAQSGVESPVVTPTKQGSTSTEGVIKPSAVQNTSKLGIVAWDGLPTLHLRSSPTTEGNNIIGKLAFNTPVQIIEQVPGEWLHLSTLGAEGYASANYIWFAPKHPLPEPKARLLRVAKYNKATGEGTAISIAQKTYPITWGNDLRFYVAVLGVVNGIPIPSSIDGWKSVAFKAGQMIWIPSQEFADGLSGMISSGSYSYELASALGIEELVKGIGDALARVAQFMSDLELARLLANKYIPMAIAKHSEEALIAALQSLLMMAMIAVGTLIICTAIGAIVGFFAGGLGAVPGAALGFEIGLALLEWLGLAFLVKWIGEAISRISSAFITFLGTLWSARGDLKKIDQAARELAEAFGTVVGVAIEALVMWAAAKGVSTALKQVKGTQFEKAFGESQLGTWLHKRVAKHQQGESLVPGPKEAVLRAQAPKLARELGVTQSEATILLRVADGTTLRALRQEIDANSISRLASKPRAYLDSFFEALQLVGTDSVARASLLEALRLNIKGTLSNVEVQLALGEYVAFMKRYGERVSGDFMSRFWRSSGKKLDNPQAQAELRLAEDLLAGKTPLGPSSNVMALPESVKLNEGVPEYRVTQPTGTRLAECKSIGEPGKPFSQNTVRANVSKAHSDQIRPLSNKTGESEGLIRLDARDAGKTDVNPAQLAEWVSGKIPSPRESLATRWVEIFYKNAQGESLKVVLELKSGRFVVHSTQVMK